MEALVIVNFCRQILTLYCKVHQFMNERSFCNNCSKRKKKVNRCAKKENDVRSTVSLYAVRDNFFLNSHK